MPGQPASVFQLLSSNGGAQKGFASRLTIRLGVREARCDRLHDMKARILNFRGDHVYFVALLIGAGVGAGAGSARATALAF